MNLKDISKKDFLKKLRTAHKHIVGKNIIPFYVVNNNVAYISLGSIEKAMKGIKGPLEPIEGSMAMDYTDWDVVKDSYLDDKFKHTFKGLGENELCFLFARGFHIPVVGAIPTICHRRHPSDNKKMVSFIGVALNIRPELADHCKVECPWGEYTYYEYGTKTPDVPLLYITEEELSVEGAVKDISEVGADWYHSPFNLNGFDFE
tara:strand:+ start:182 stop:793 length:612 start_codon:yes stop_codon:yes gene_type:complete